MFGVDIGGGVITYLRGAIGGGVGGVGVGFYTIRLGLVTFQELGFKGAGRVLFG